MEENPSLLPIQCLIPEGEMAVLDLFPLENRCVYAGEASESAAFSPCPVGHPGHV